METEMQSASSHEALKKSLSISPKMSAPTIHMDDNRLTIWGSGLALAAVSIEQDAAYWEWHVSLPSQPNDKVPRMVDDILFGVAAKRDPKLYEKLKEKSVPGTYEREG